LGNATAQDCFATLLILWEGEAPAEPRTRATEARREPRPPKDSKLEFPIGMIAFTDAFD